MHRALSTVIIVFTGAVMLCCTRSRTSSYAAVSFDTVAVIQPVFICDTVVGDTDDPAIWINQDDPSASLIIGTDKGGNNGEGGLYVFNLQGREIVEKRISGLKRPNNVDVAYGVDLGGKKVDVAICTERRSNSIRVFTLPEMTPVDNGGIPVFEGETFRAPMRIATYAHNGKTYAIVGRKDGVDGSYLWQYELSDNGRGVVTATLVRKFGRYSGKKEIESIAVDSELGYVYYSDEGVGVHKYYAHPDSSNTELALFATQGFSEDHEGISIYKATRETGYIVVSDQGADKFQIFPREGNNGNNHDHPVLRVVKVSAHKSDGSEITSTPLPGFPKGFFVVMSDDRTFHIYSSEDIIEGPKPKSQAQRPRSNL